MNRISCLGTRNPVFSGKTVKKLAYLRSTIVVPIFLVVAIHGQPENSESTLWTRTLQLRNNLMSIPVSSDVRLVTDASQSNSVKLSAQSSGNRASYTRLTDSRRAHKT